MSVIVKGSGGKPEEEKTVTAGTSVIEVNSSSGNVMKKVTVNPTPTESKSVTPTTSELTVTPSEGKHLSQVVVGAVEDVTPEVTAQTPLVTQIAENLGVTITTPSGTNKQILQGNNANLLNIKDNAKKTGAYVWKKLTAQDGDFVDFVVSDSETAYPDGGEQDGYWYEKVTSASFGIAFGEITVASKVKSVTVEHNLGVKPKLVVVVPFGASKSTPESVQLQLFSADSFCDTPIFGAVYRVSTHISSDYIGTGSITPVSQADESQITFKSSAAAVYFQGTYKWFALV